MIYIIMLIICVIRSYIIFKSKMLFLSVAEESIQMMGKRLKSEAKFNTQNRDKESINWIYKNCGKLWTVKDCENIINNNDLYVDWLYDFVPLVALAKDQEDYVKKFTEFVSRVKNTKFDFEKYVDDYIKSISNLEIDYATFDKKTGEYK
jgi:hypothetical protein